MTDADDVLDELDPKPAYEALPVSRRATLQALASVGALGTVGSAQAQEAAGGVSAEEAYFSNYGWEPDSDGGTLTIDGDEYVFDGSDEIELPDGSTATEAVLPDGASAGELIGPDGELLWNIPVADFEVSISSTNEPINEAETLDVDYEVENVGDDDGVQDIRLEIDGEQEDIDYDVDLDTGETETGTLFWSAETGETGSFSAVVFSDDDSDDVSVNVNEPVVVDDFEEGIYDGQSLNDYYSGDLSNFDRQQSTVFEGDYAVECRGDESRINSVAGDKQDLPNYPSQGDTFEFWTYLTGESDSRFAFGVQSVNNNYNEDSYEIQFRPLNSRFALSVDGSDLDTDNTSPPADEWIRTEVDWGSFGSISIVVEDESGTELASLSADDETYTSGGIGFGSREDKHYHDGIFVFE